MADTSSSGSGSGGQGILDLLDGSLIKNDGLPIPSSEVITPDTEIVGVYFGDGTLKACEAFENELKPLYDGINSEGKRFAVLFISHDETEAAMRKTLSRMPWHGIPFHSEAEGKLRRLLGTSILNIVPGLFLLNAR